MQWPGQADTPDDVSLEKTRQFGLCRCHCVMLSFIWNKRFFILGHVSVLDLLNKFCILPMYTMCSFPVSFGYIASHRETQLASPVYHCWIEFLHDWSATKTKGSPSIVVRKEWCWSSPFWCGYTSCLVDSSGISLIKSTCCGKPLPYWWWDLLHACDHYCWHWDSISLPWTIHRNIVFVFGFSAIYLSDIFSFALFFLVDIFSLHFN